MGLAPYFVQGVRPVTLFKIGIVEVGGGMCYVDEDLSLSIRLPVAMSDRATCG